MQDQSFEGDGVTAETSTKEIVAKETGLADELWVSMAGTEAERGGKSEREKLLAWTGIADALAIRKEIAISGKVPEENRLVQIRNEIVDNEKNLLTKEDLAQVEALNNYLREEPELVDQLVESLIGVQEKMMDTLGVGVKSSAIGHIREVVALVKKGSPEMPLAALMAAAHDMVKLTAVEDEKGNKTDLVLTAEHEVLSAMAAQRMGDVLVAHLAKVKGWEEISYSDGRRGGVAKLFSYILTHGEGEYPEVVAGKSTIVEVDGVKVGTMGGGEYVFNPKSSEVVLGQEEVDTMLVRGMLEAVSGADKLVGMSPDSLVKYLVFTPEQTIFDFEGTDHLLFDQVMASFIGNYKNSPDSELKKDFLHSDEVHQSILILLSLRSGNQLGDLGGPTIDFALYGEKAERIRGRVDKFKGFFGEVKSGKITVDNPKSTLVTYFRELATAIKEINLVDSPELAKVAAQEAERILINKTEQTR